MKLSLQGDAIKLCLIHNEEKPYVTERFKVTGNKKVYIDKLDVSTQVQQQIQSSNNQNQSKY